MFGRKKISKNILMLWFIKKKVLMLNEVMGTSGAENRVDGVVRGARVAR